MVGASTDALGTVKHSRTQIIANRHELVTAAFVRQPEASVQAPGLMAKLQHAAGADRVRTLDAQAIACQKQCPFVRIPDRKGENSIEPSQQFRNAFCFLPVHQIQLQQHFRVGIAEKCMTLLLQLRIQFAEVVDFAIEYQHYTTICADHGLMPSRAQVDDS